MPARSRTSNRVCGVDSDHFANAWRAAAMARSTSAAVPRANSPTTSLRLDGLRSTKRSAVSIDRPSMRFGNMKDLGGSCYEKCKHRSRLTIFVTTPSRHSLGFSMSARSQARRPSPKSLWRRNRARARCERLAGGGGDRHGHARGVRRLDDERQVLVRQVDREPGRSIALQHLRRPRDLELAVRRRRPWITSSVFSSARPNRCDSASASALSWHEMIAR